MKLGIIGLGKMGAFMAERLLIQGHEAVADAIRSGTKAGRENSMSITSTANSTPAMGLLKMAEIPAATPQASMSVRSR